MISFIENTKDMHKYLTSTPQVTFCKSLYKRYANFRNTQYFYDMEQNMDTNMVSLKLYPSSNHEVTQDVYLIEKTGKKINYDDIANICVYICDNNYEQTNKMLLHDYDNNMLSFVNNVKATSYNNMILIPYINNLFMNSLK